MTPRSRFVSAALIAASASSTKISFKGADTECHLSLSAGGTLASDCGITLPGRADGELPGLPAFQECTLSNPNGELVSSCDIAGYAKAEHTTTLQASVDAMGGFMQTQLCPAKLTAAMRADSNGPRALHGFCKYSCLPGFHDEGSNGACTSCKTASVCGIGEALGGTCSTVSDKTCTACTTKPGFSEYTARGHCEYDCTGGYDKTASNQCDACPAGHHDGKCNTAFPTAHQLVTLLSAFFSALVQRPSG